MQMYDLNWLKRLDLVFLDFDSRDIHAGMVFLSLVRHNGTGKVFNRCHGKRLGSAPY